MKLNKLLAAMASTFVLSSSLWAQQGSMSAANAVPARVSQVISVNPLMLVFGGISAEWERKTAENTSFGLAGGLQSEDHFSYLSAEAKYRFYPDAKSLRGFSVGGAGGFTSASTDYFGSSWSGQAASVGVVLDYQWLLGENGNFAVALGGGAKRLFYFGSNSGASDALLTLRLSIGFAR